MTQPLMRNMIAPLAMFAMLTAAQSAPMVASDIQIAAVTAAEGVEVLTDKGRVLRKLPHDPGVVLGRHSWSPDGRQLLFMAATVEKSAPPLHFGLYTLGADGQSEKRVVDFPVAADAVWSPDGKFIAFTSAAATSGEAVAEGEPNAALYVVEVAAAKVTQLTRGHRDASPSWSPDGTRVAFVRAGEKYNDVYVVKRDGGAETRLSTLPMRVANPIWSSDGKTIAFLGDGVLIMDSDGGRKRRVTPLRGSSVAWIPGRDELLVTAGGGLFVYAASTGIGRNIVAAEEKVVEADAAPDGSIIYRTARGGEQKLYRLDASGGKPRLLSTKTNYTSFAVSSR